MGCIASERRVVMRQRQGRLNGSGFHRRGASRAGENSRPSIPIPVPNALHALFLLEILQAQFISLAKHAAGKIGCQARRSRRQYRDLEFSRDDRRRTHRRPQLPKRRPSRATRGQLFRAVQAPRQGAPAAIPARRNGLRENPVAIALFRPQILRRRATKSTLPLRRMAHQSGRDISR